MKVLAIIDMQKDFIDGALGTSEAAATLPAVVQTVHSFEGTVLFTRDTHGPDYLQTQEGRNLPVPHCIRGSEGWQLAPQLQEYAAIHASPIFDKPTFGSRALADFLLEVHTTEPIEEITLIGLCTDICVISNALNLKAALPEVPISVIESCCAGVTPESHKTALRAMQMCQITIR